ncbi:hypothetical protein OQI89_01020 [Lentilactobacillus diolivorans]|jgi:hypothetical protein|nr:hypothetical protein [Lentilactobacillus diolivorans]MDH5104424.1 hypothetical protein [Lentilactobacillus diolivorans]RRG04555.1 MAG: hypothetical protein DUD34_01340 [Lactobacillus sp.]GEP22619.1 hypothetical protein LDI01_02120 [Lentilactobacillus diolivorans]
MLTINVNGNLGNQEVMLSDNTSGTLTGVRIFGSVIGGNQVIQWTFISTGHKHEGFVYAGDLHEGLVINSMNGNDQYKVHFVQE